MPTIGNESEIYAVTHAYWCYSVPAEVVLSQGGDAEEPALELRHQLEQKVLVQMSATRSSSFGTFRAIPTSTQIPKPFRALRRLETNWDGTRGEAPSEALIRRGEELWSILEELGLPEMPVVKAGAEGLLAFSWLSHYPNNHMEISLCEGENDCFSCDWYTKKGENIVEGSADYPWGELRNHVIDFFAI